MTRTGKIARLPRALRDQINQRLQNGEPADPILAWLNPLPEVQALLQAHFEGIPISKQNLSEWRQGGYVEWELKGDLMYDARETSADSEELDPVPAGSLADHLATILSARYASLIRHWDGDPTNEFHAKLKAMHALVQDISQLRRWDHDTAKLHLAQDKLEDQRQKAHDEEIATLTRKVEGRQRLVEFLTQVSALAESRKNAAHQPPSYPVKPNQSSSSPTEPVLPVAAPRQSAAEMAPVSPELPPIEVSPASTAESNPVKLSQTTVTPLPLVAASRQSAAEIPPASSPAVTAPAEPPPPKPRTSYDVWPEFVAAEMDQATYNSLPNVSRPRSEVMPKVFYDPSRGTFAILTEPDQPQYPDSLRWGKGRRPEYRPYRPTMCQGKCNLHGGICTGCQRTEEEITLWPVLTRAERIDFIHSILNRRLANGQIK